jgi:ABC-type phosphate transport system auxiliary subunit
VAFFGGLGGLALPVAVILLAAGALVDGFILLGLATALLVLCLVGLRREPHMPAARLILQALDRLRSLAALTVVTVRASVGAAVNLLRIRHRRRQLDSELDDRMAPLGEAVYREDQQRAQALKRQAAELEHELDEAQREATSVIGHARREIEQERAALEPTQALPRVR